MQWWNRKQQQERVNAEGNKNQKLRGEKTSIGAGKIRHERPEVELQCKKKEKIMSENN